MTKRLDVLYGCDDNYAPYAAVSICSLLENNRDFNEINIYVVMDNVSAVNREKLECQAKRYAANLIQIDANDIVKKIIELGLPKYRNSYGTNFRLFFTDYIHSDVEKLLYLDCDTIICGSLSALVEEDMQDRCAYVVQESLVDSYKTLLGFADDVPYFNAGVMLFNVNNWKKDDCSGKILAHLVNQRAKYCNPDQDLLNIVLKDSVKYIGPEYNFQPIHRMLSIKEYKRIYRNKAYYDDKTIGYAEMNPKILHTYRFLGQFPWHMNNLHPDNRIFDKYLRISTQKDYEKRKAKDSLLFMGERVLYVLLPRPLFFRIFKKVQEISFKKQNRKLESK